MKPQPPKRFTGFSPAALRFLRDLAKNNNRDWFLPRKQTYETELLEPLRALAADATQAMRKAKIPIAADPLRPTFRIYRDIRFSLDKRPYKTNLGVYLPPAGQHDAAGGLYVHIQPKQSFMALAFYQLDKPHLLRWRTAMAKDPKRFQAMLRALEKNGLNISDDGDALKRMPRGFETFEGSPISGFFKYRSFIASDQLSDADIADDGLIERTVVFVKKARPLLNFGWQLLNKAARR